METVLDALRAMKKRLIARLLPVWISSPLKRSTCCASRKNRVYVILRWGMVFRYRERAETEAYQTQADITAGGEGAVSNAGAGSYER